MMKKFFFLLFTIFAWVFPQAIFADGEERLALRMAEQSITLKDTLSARDILCKIATKCEKSEEWEVRFKFYLLRGCLNSFDSLNMQDAARDYFYAWMAFPDTVAPTQEYLAVACNYCGICYDLKYSQPLAEYVARKSLLRASNIVNDCFASAELFSLLAGFYELRGDTIMPSHFHRKSQELSIKYYIRSTVPTDSLDIHFKRLKNLMERIDNNKQQFNRDLPDYLIWLDILSSQVSAAGNNRESIYLAEYIVQTVRDSMLFDLSNHVFDAYYTLIYSYAVENRLEQALDLLPEAEAYYDRKPEAHITKAVLYYSIGQGLVESRSMQTQKAVHYLLLAKENLSEKYHADYISNINKLLTLCNAD